MKLRNIITAAFALLVVVMATAQVKPGIEVLRQNGFDLLQGKRIGLITNPTGVDNNLKSTIDILHEASGVELVALFAPEHGVRGDIPAGKRVTSMSDPETGVKIYSLYGATRKPTADMLRGIDVLVYDIQDNGCRSYTFISTMGLAMEACARHGIEFMVLDRPNPLGGNKVEGPVTETDCQSFVSQFPIPYLYALTPGELAQLIVGEKMISTLKPLKLTVVPMKGWKRNMLFADTQMPWVMPSPHIPSAETAVYYPASGIAGELEYLSIGVGYTVPFRTFAASWIDGAKLADRLNKLNLPGLRFRRINYKPYYGFGKGVNLSGVEMFVTDYDKAELTLTQFYVMQELAEMYPSHRMSVGAASNRFSMFDKVTGTRKVRQLFTKRHKVADIYRLWHRDTDNFIKTKRKYEIYR